MIQLASVRREHATTMVGGSTKSKVWLHTGSAFYMRGTGRSDAAVDERQWMGMWCEKGLGVFVR